MYWSRQYLLIEFATPALTPITLKSVYRRKDAHFNLVWL